MQYADWLHSLCLNRHADKFQGSILASLFSGIDTMLAQFKSIGKGLGMEGFKAGTSKQPIEILGVRISVHSSSTFDTRELEEQTRYVHLGHSYSHVSVLTYWGRLQEQSSIDFDSVLRNCSQCTRETPPSRSPPRATFQLGGESPGLDPTPDEDATENPSIARTNLAIGSAFCPSLEQEALEYKTRMILSEMKQELSKLHEEVTDRQMKMAELENRIQLAELCLPPFQSRDSSSQANFVRQGQPQPELRAMSSPAAEFIQSQAELTFSPSDQTLVERGQTAVSDAQRLLSITGNDIEMTPAPDVLDFNLQSPAGLAADLQQDFVSEIAVCDHVQSAAACPPKGDQSRKRRRVSKFFSSQSSILEVPSLAMPQGLSHTSKSEYEETQQGWKQRFRGRNRISRILLGQLSVLQSRLENIGTATRINPSSLTGPNAMKTDLERPVSYPQSQRWRKSFGVSVKSLTEGFEKMRVKQNDKRLPPLPSA